MPNPRNGEDITHLMNGSQPHDGEDITNLMNAAPTSAEPSFFDKLGGWRGLAAGGTRALSGILSAEGGLPGAAVSGLGEGAAELIEGGLSGLDPAKIGVESGFGAIPFGKVVRGGKLASSALRSGLLGAAHAATSDVTGKAEAGATGTDLLPDPKSTAIAGGLGALLGAGGSAWMDRAAKAKLAAPVKAPSNTAQEVVAARTLAMNPFQRKQLGQAEGQFETALSRKKAGFDRRASSLEDMFNTSVSNKNTAMDAEALKAEQEAGAQRQIRQQVKEEGLIKGDPNIKEAIVPGGTKLTSSTPYVSPEADTGATGSKAAAITRDQQLRGLFDIGANEAPAPKPEIPIQVPQEPAVSPASAEPGTLATLFKSPVDAAGSNYRAAKEAVGENPLARQAAGVALNKEAAAAGLPTKGSTNLGKFLESRVSPDISAASTEASPTRRGNFLDQLKASAEAQPEAPAAPPAVDPAAMNEPDARGELWREKAGMRPLAEQLSPIDPRGQKGAVNPMLMRLMSGGVGAGVGAPTWAIADPDDPYAPLKGAAAGGILGFAGMTGAQDAMAKGQSALGGVVKESTYYRNAGLLAGIAQAKKPLSDVGAIISTAGEKLLTKGQRDQGGQILKELLRMPTNASNYGRALKNPELAGEVIGDALRSNAPVDRGALGWVGRPFGAAQYASQQVLERAGISPEEARRILFLGNPSDEGGAAGALSQAYLNLQDPAYLEKLLPEQWRGKGAGRNAAQLIRTLRPFARISSNLFSQGVTTLPGMSLMTGSPETKLARTVLGTGAFAAGAGTGMWDQASEEAGNGVTSTPVRGLRRAALAKYALPFIAGEAMFGPRGASDLYNAVPGMNAMLQKPGPKDTIVSYGGKQIRNWLGQMLPGFLDPTGAEKPIR